MRYVTFESYELYCKDNINLYIYIYIYIILYYTVDNTLVVIRLCY